MQLYLQIIILILFCLAYLISFYFILKKRKHSVISIRSPTLLFLNNLGGFLMTVIYLSYEIVENITYPDDPDNKTSNSDLLKDDSMEIFCRILPSNYFICHCLMIISFILRCHRIIECCKINYDERTEIKQFYERRYLFKERYYIKVLFGCIVVIAFLMLFLNLKYHDVDNMLIPYHFRYCMKDREKMQIYVSLSWIIINFVEGFVLVTYTYIIATHKIKQLIKIELIAFLVIWFIYPNLLRLSNFVFYVDYDSASHWTCYVCCLFLGICLVINGYLPIIFTYFDKYSISYHFNPKLANNLYLFLSDEYCFYSFYNYLLDSDQNTADFDLYIHILKYKFLYGIEPDFTKVVAEAKIIYEEYFLNNRVKFFLGDEVLNKVKSSCQLLNSDDCNYEIFDDALLYVYENLLEMFKKYKISEEYQILIDNLNLNSYIQCKMSNTGLINRY